MVECGRPTSLAINRGPQPVRSRTAQIAACSCAGSIAGLVRGRDERSSKQLSDWRSAGLADRHRQTHLWTVDLTTFEAAAAASNV
jgi:hypothetical protein